MIRILMNTDPKQEKKSGDLEIFKVLERYLGSATAAQPGTLMTYK